MNADAAFNFFYSALLERSLRIFTQESTVATTSTQSDLVSMIAHEVVSGIDEAVGYWLGRIERELVGRSLSPEQQLRAIERVIREYKEATGQVPFCCAQA